MLTSSTVIFSIGSGERKRCSNMAPVRRLRGVRCSTENTECKSLLCLMIIPGRSWVAGIDMRVKVSSKNCDRWDRRSGPRVRRARGSNTLVYTEMALVPNLRRVAVGNPPESRGAWEYNRVVVLDFMDPR